MIPISVPFIDQKEIDAVAEVLKTGMLVQGKNVLAFESDMTNWLSPRHKAVAVSNGTAALHMALLAFNVGPGDFVAVPTYSWPATANAVELCGAQPIFIDIETQTWGMDPEKLELALSQAKQKKQSVKAVLIVHAFGCPAQMTPLLSICRDYNVALIEDAACAIGSTWHGQNVGTLGAMGCFSFHPRKVVTTGEGGLISTASAEMDRTLRALRNHGQDPTSTHGPDFISAGFNYRMTDFQAALGRVQLGKLPQMLEKRKRLAKIYIDHLSKNTDVGFQTPMEQTETNWQTFVVTLPPKIKRQDVIQKLGVHGITAMMGTWHIPLIRYFQTKYGYQSGQFPITDQIFVQSMSLPLHHGMSEEDVLMIAKAVQTSLS